VFFFFFYSILKCLLISYARCISSNCTFFVVTMMTTMIFLFILLLLPKMKNTMRTHTNIQTSLHRLILQNLLTLGHKLCRKSLQITFMLFSQYTSFNTSFCRGSTFPFTRLKHMTSTFLWFTNSKTSLHTLLAMTTTFTMMTNNGTFSC